MSSVMSKNRLKRTNLLNNVVSQTTSALTGFRPVLGEIVTGGDMRGTDRDRAAEALRDREVERIKAGSGAINLTSSVFGGQAGGARAMILVNLFNAPFSLREFPYRIRRDPDRFGTRCPGSLQAGAGRQGPRAWSEAVLNKDAFQFGKQAT